MEQNKIQKEETGILALLAFRYLPFWPLFVILAAAGIAAAWTWLKYSVPQYQATATIMVKDEKKGVDDAKLLDALNIYSSTKIVENEIEVLRSRPIMLEVVQELKLYAPVSENGDIKTVSAYRSSPVVIEAKDLHNITEAKDVPFRYSKGKVRLGGKEFALNQWVKTPYGELRFLQNPRKAKDAIDELTFSLHKPENITEKYLSKLQVSAASKLSTVINLSIQDEVRQRAEDILGKVLENYTSLSIIEKNKLAANTLSFVNERLRFVEAELDSMETAIQRFKSRKGVTNLGEEGRLYLHGMGDNDQKAADIKVQMAVLDQIEKYIVSRDPSSGILPSTLGVTDPALGEMLQKLRDAELRYQVLSQTTPENNPMSVALANEIENIRPGILENVRNQKLSLRASKNQIEHTSGGYIAQLRSLPVKERELFDLSRQQVIINDVYTFLLHKREETALTYAATVADSWVVNTPQSGSMPVSPNRMMIYVIAFILSIALAVGIITAREVLNKKILFRTEIEAATQVPVAAELLFLKGQKDLLIPQDRPSAIAEQFRQLRAAIGMYGRTTAIRKLLVTSSIPGEGKSFVSLNLAISLATSGKKVLLLDLDLRNPSISTQTGLAGKEGMTEYLQGKVSATDIIHNVIHKNLFAIGAGSEVVNPTELLLGGDLAALLDMYQEHFDYLVLDSSPVLPVTDASILSDYADTTLFIIRHNHTPKIVLQSLEQNAKIRSLKKVSIVFNGICPRGLVKGRYGYGTGYGYEYLYKDKPVKAPKEALKL